MANDVYRFDVEYVEDHDYSQCEVAPHFAQVEVVAGDIVAAELRAVSMVRAVGKHPTRAVLAHGDQS